MPTFRFDDVDAMNAAASEEFGEWGPEIAITQEMINEFADLTGDHQWIHVDVERAVRESPFGGPIAHGFLTLSLLPRMMTESSTTITGHTNAANYGADKLRFIAPVPAGSSTAGTDSSKPWPGPRARCSRQRSRWRWWAPTVRPCSTPCRHCICDPIVIGARNRALGRVPRFRSTAR
jgi:hypothetical protein